MNSATLPTQRKFDEFSGQETVKKTMEIFTEALAKMYIEDQKLQNKKPMDHLMNELNIETEIIDPQILEVENKELLDEVENLRAEFSRLTKEHVQIKQKNRGDKRKEKYGSALSGPSYANKQKVDIKDLDEITTKNSRANKKSRG